MIQELTSRVDADTTVYLLAIENGAVVGILRIDLDGYIWSLFIAEESRNKGLGTALIEEACEVLRKNGRATVGLSVHKDNDGARRLYERLGFLQYMPRHDNYTQFVKVL